MVMIDTMGYHTMDDKGLPLLAASDEGRLEIVKNLLEEGADIDTRNDVGKTPLHLASINGHLEVVKLLVEKGADINIKSYGDYTPLICAVLKNNKDMAELLMFSGKNVDIPNFDLFTMLHWASCNGSVNIVRRLVERGWDLDEKEAFGGTALVGACRMNQLETAQALLQSGANWDVVDDKGNSLLEYLTIIERPIFIKLLIENGAYLKPAEYNAIVKSSSLNVLQDARFCCQAIVNKFNNHDLSELYKVLASKSLPRIERMKIASGSEVTQAIERTVGYEIRTKGHCNILEVRPIALSVFSVRSILEFYKKKTSELKNQMKRPAAFDSVSYQHSSKLMRFS